MLYKHILGWCICILVISVAAALDPQPTPGGKVLYGTTGTNCYCETFSALHGNQVIGQGKLTHDPELGCIYSIGFAAGVVTDGDIIAFILDGYLSETVAEITSETIIRTDIVFSDLPSIYTDPISGCTDELAKNYDAFAETDDGSCEYISGCTDLGALNYDAEATKDDGSCTYPEGCTDEDALNFDSVAQVDDGSCIYPVDGCTDSEAYNYDADATQDDGSCIYLGCTDESASNYDPSANVDDGSCLFFGVDTPIGGCLDPDAQNYDAYVDFDDGSCSYAEDATQDTTTQDTETDFSDDASSSQHSSGTHSSGGSSSSQAHEDEEETIVVQGTDTNDAEVKQDAADAEDVASQENNLLTGQITGNKKVISERTIAAIAMNVIAFSLLGITIFVLRRRN